MSDKRSPKNIFVFNIIYFFPLCVLYSIQIYAFSQKFLVSSTSYLIGYREDGYKNPKSRFKNIK